MNDQEALDFQQLLTTCQFPEPFTLLSALRDTVFRPCYKQ
jgi:hypothetical protein